MNHTRAALSQTLYKLHRYSRKIWVRSSLITLLGVVAAAGSGVLAPLVPEAIAEAVKPDAVEKILDILASGMLAVVIFSLSVMLSARQSASQQVTPRSHQLLMEDVTTQNVLSTFLGSFLFSLVGVITLGTQVYSGDAAAVILFFTLIVIALIIIAILRWIAHLSELGSVVETTRKVERAARDAMETWLDDPCIGGTPLLGTSSGMPEPCAQTGYIQHIDMGKLSEQADEGDFQVYLNCRPGSFVARGGILFYHSGARDLAGLHDAFTVGDTRRFDQDPRFGVIVLTEIAQRALSPGINDPGTAIDVLTRQHRMLALFRDRMEQDGGKSVDEPSYPRVHVPPLSAVSLVQDAFDPIARDGAATVEVQIRLQKVLADLASGEHPEMREAAVAASLRARKRAMGAITLADDRDRLSDAIDERFAHVRGWSKMTSQ